MAATSDLTPEARSARHRLLHELWGQMIHMDDIAARVNSDGFTPWKLSYIRGFGRNHGLTRPDGANLVRPTGYVAPFQHDSYERALTDAGITFDDVVFRDNGKPRMGIMSRPDPRVGLAAFAAREGRRGKVGGEYHGY